jgi:ribosome-binding protein aMBF1 (putative translation factor)
MTTDIKTKTKTKTAPKSPAKRKAKAKTNGKPKAARTDSKQARFIAALRTARGMSIEEAAKEFGWQAHTVRGAVAGALKRKLKLKVEAERDEKRGTVYRISA